MKQETKDKAPSWGAVIIACATAIGGFFTWMDSREKAKISEEYRVEADEAILEKVNAQFEAYAEQVDEELDILSDENAALEHDIIELQIRVGVLQGLNAGAAVDADALLEEIRKASERRGVPVEEVETMVSTDPIPVEDLDAKVEKLTRTAKGSKREKPPRPAPFAFEDDKREEQFREQIQQKAY